MKFKQLLAVLLAGTISFGASLTAAAGEWYQNDFGWWYQEDNGYCPVDTWQWIDSNGDGIYKSYYFDDLGYTLMNTVTPDGKQVDESGAWTVNGQVHPGGG